MLLNFIFVLQKKCESSAASSNATKMTTSISKLKRKLVNNIQSPPTKQAKQTMVASCDKLASHPVEVCHPKRGLVNIDFCSETLK
jgi:transcription elongation factor